MTSRLVTIESIPPRVIAAGQIAVGRLVIRRGQRELFQVIDAMHPAGGFMGRLYRGEQKRDQDSDDRDDDEQLDERERATLAERSDSAHEILRIDFRFGYGDFEMTRIRVVSIRINEIRHLRPPCQVCLWPFCHEPAGQVPFP